MGLYLQTRVCIQTFLDFWVCKRSVFYEKGLYSDKNGRSNDKVIITTKNIGGEKIKITNIYLQGDKQVAPLFFIPESQNND